MERGMKWMLLLTAALTLAAGDLSEKDARKLLTNSAWAHTVTVVSTNATPRPGTTDRVPEPNPTMQIGPMTETGASPMSGRSPRAGVDESAALSAVVRWQSALPVREALVRMKMLPPSVLQQNLSDYVVIVSGVMQTSHDSIAMKRGATLAVKGRDPTHATDVEFKGLDTLFVFPRTLTLDDREVEFSATFGTASVRTHFRLKDMVYAGKLEL
jgi:hypothetical protein